MDHAATSRILFLCTGNYYRSRFAEEYFNHRSPVVAPDWVASSRGLRPLPDVGGASGNPGPISIHALTFLNLYQIKAQNLFRYPLQVSGEELASADRIIALSEREHKPMMTALHEAFERRVQYFDIDDIDVDEPARAIPKLVHCLDHLMRELG